MLWSAVKEILLRLTLSIRMKKRYHKAKFGIFFFLQREEKKLQQLHYLWVDNSKLRTHFCTAHCLQTESIHRDRLSLSRIKAGWPIVYILSPATKPGTHPSSVSPNPLLIKPRSYRAPSRPPSFSGEPAQVQHQPHADSPALEPPWEMQGQQDSTGLLWAAPLTPEKKQKQRGSPVKRHSQSSSTKGSISETDPALCSSYRGPERYHDTEVCPVQNPLLVEIVIPHGAWEQQLYCFLSPAGTWQHCWSGCTVTSNSQETLQVPSWSCIYASIT